MPTRKTTRKKSSNSASPARAKKPASQKSRKKSTAKKGATGKSGKKPSRTRLLDKAKKALKAVFVGAASGAAEGAVVGAAEAGRKATGIEENVTSESSKPATRKAAKK